MGTSQPELKAFAPQFTVKRGLNRSDPGEKGTGEHPRRLNPGDTAKRKGGTCAACSLLSSSA